MCAGLGNVCAVQIRHVCQATRGSDSGAYSVVLTVAIEAIDEWYKVGIAHDVLEGVAADARCAPSATALAAMWAADGRADKAAIELSARVHQAVRGLETEWPGADVCCVGRVGSAAQ